MKNDKLDAIAILSSGRQLFSETAQSLLRTVPVLSNTISDPVLMGGGAYWDQGLQGMTEAALKHGTKYLLYLDGDSVFSMQDVYDLYGLIESCSVGGQPIDAVFPVQADRMGQKPLAYNWAAPQIQYDHNAPWMPYIHGHFGLTFIRCEALLAMPKPWLMGVPNSDGTWNPGNGKQDPDTYFWMKFNANKRVAVLANHTVIGHIQVGIRWQMAGKVAWQHYGDFLKRGKPYGCRAPLPSEFPEPHPTNTTSGKTGPCIDGADVTKYSPPEYDPDEADPADMKQEPIASVAAAGPVVEPVLEGVNT